MSSSWSSSTSTCTISTIVGILSIAVRVYSLLIVIHWLFCLLFRAIIIFCLLFTAIIIFCLLSRVTVVFSLALFISKAFIVMIGLILLIHSITIVWVSSSSINVISWFYLSVVNWLSITIDIVVIDYIKDTSSYPPNYLSTIPSLPSNFSTTYHYKHSLINSPYFIDYLLVYANFGSIWFWT